MIMRVHVPDLNHTRASVGVGGANGFDCSLITEEQSLRLDVQSRPGGAKETTRFSPNAYRTCASHGGEHYFSARVDRESSGGPRHNERRQVPRGSFEPGTNT